MVFAVQATRHTFHLHFEKIRRIDPDVARVAGAVSHLEVIRIVSLDLFDSLQLNFLAFRCVVDEISVEIRLRRLRLELLGREVLDLVPVQK